MTKDEYGTILPAAVLPPPPRMRRITLVLVDVVHPAAMTERLAEHKDPPALQEQGLQIPECPGTGSRHPCGRRGIRRRRAQLGAAVVVDGSGPGAGFKCMPPVGQALQLNRKRGNGIDDPPLQPVRKVLAVKVDRAAEIPAPRPDPEVAVIVLPRLP